MGQKLAKKVDKDTTQLYAKYSNTALIPMIMLQTGYKPPKKETDASKIQKKKTTIKQTKEVSANNTISIVNDVQPFIV